MQRPLTLHASALTDPEYTLYTTALLDLAGEDPAAHPHDDSYYAALVVSARETRAWVRGRYTELAPTAVDAVLRLFTPNIAPADTLSGGQFFAALRLVTHIRHGRPLDGSLVFVQAHPDDAGSPPLQNNSPPAVEPGTTNDSPAHSRNTSREGHLIDDSPGPSAPPTLPPKPALPPTPSSSTNPFINRTKTQESIATVSSATTATPTGTLRAKPVPAPVLQPQPVIPPLPPRKSAPAPPEDKGKPPPPPPPRHATGNLTQTPASPFAFWHNQSTVQSPNTLIQQSLQAGRIAQSLKKADQKLEKERVMQVLKSSTPSGSKDAGSKDKRTRSESPSKGLAALTISTPGPSAIARSYSVSSGSDSSSADAPKSAKGPALPPRRRVSPPNSAWSGRSGRTDGARSAISATSFREVANASVASRRNSTSRERRASPPPLHPALIPQPSPVIPVLPALASEKGPPPTHPGRKPPPPVPGSAPASATNAVFSDADGDLPSPTSAGRVFRSKSMHYPSSPPVPPPRPRRRPESVQFGAGGMPSGMASPRRAPSPTFTERTDRSTRSVNTVLSSPASLPHRGATVSRHLSLSQHGASTPRARRSDSLTGDGPPTPGLKDGLRDRWAGLQPRLDKARWKAEAGLSRRGFVSHRGGSVFRREGEERLVDTDDDDEDDGAPGADRVFDDEEPSVDRDYRASDDEGRGRVRSASGAERTRRPWEVERDEMKWPVAPGEGWTPL